ncbi:hypothetical protein F5878DRAFT_407188 [Lentinula raphanica]|uniref:Uncharacterized protein n=1 Tax=Lentinula raphanica TaxID=153919 RepID=A0AA38PG06_9AGAR|nr:hypothetical protein F5878DRAFT_407188 [Lentinula raphanica]
MDTRYIDDQYGDLVSNVTPTYSPEPKWSQGAGCSGCALHPDPTQAFDYTWHESTHWTSDAESETVFVSLEFTGTSLDVFCILPNPSGPTTVGDYNLTFELDNQLLEQTFMHTNNRSDIFEFNVNVLSLQNLSLVPHVFMMMAGVDSTIQFDYATYTVPRMITSSSNPSSSLLTSSSPAASPSQNSVTSSAGPSQNSAIAAVLIAPIVVATFVATICLGVALQECYFWYKRHWHFHQNGCQDGAFPLGLLCRENTHVSIPESLQTHTRSQEQLSAI